MSDRPPCRCGHAHAAHQHHRAGHDCGICGWRTCYNYRAAHLTRAELHDRLADAQRELAAVTAELAEVKRALLVSRNREIAGERRLANVVALAPFVVATLDLDVSLLSVPQQRRSA